MTTPSPPPYPTVESMTWALCPSICPLSSPWFGSDNWRSVLHLSLRGMHHTGSQVKEVKVQGHNFSHALLSESAPGIFVPHTPPHWKQMQVISSKCAEAGMSRLECFTTRVAFFIWGVCVLNTLFICCGMTDSHLCSHRLSRCQYYNGFSCSPVGYYIRVNLIHTNTSLWITYQSNLPSFLICYIVLLQQEMYDLSCSGKNS